MHNAINTAFVLIVSFALFGVGDFRAHAANSPAFQEAMETEAQDSDSRSAFGEYDPEGAHRAAASMVEPDGETFSDEHFEPHGDHGEGLDPAGEHADIGHGKSAGLPQLDPEWFASQIFWLILTFSGLYAIFARKILPDLSGILETRRTTVQGDLGRASHLKNESEKLQNEYETALAQAVGLSSQMFDDIEKDIKAQTAEKLSDLRTRSAKEIQKAEAAIEKAQKEAMDDMTTVAAELASLAAEKIVGLSTDIDQARSVIQNINKKAA